MAKKLRTKDILEKEEEVVRMEFNRDGSQKITTETTLKPVQKHIYDDVVKIEPGIMVSNIYDVIQT